MKIAITSADNRLHSKFDTRFGRSAWFCMLDTETGETEFFENENKHVNGGAGAKAAEKMAERGIQKVISGDFGPKAKVLLERLKIEMIVLDEKDKKIDEIIEELKKNTWK